MITTVNYARKSTSVDSVRNGATSSRRPNVEGRKEGRREEGEGREGSERRRDREWHRSHARASQHPMRRWKSFYGDDDFELSRKARDEWPKDGSEPPS